MDFPLKGLAKEVEKVQACASEIQETAVFYGMSPSGVNLKNAILFIKSLLGQHAEAEKTAHDLGYKSLEIALKALAQTKSPNAHLPEVFQIFPAHWLEDSGLLPLSKRIDGLTVSRVYKKKAVTSTQAQAALKRIQPDLARLYDFIKDDEGLLNEVIAAYEDLSYNDFCESLYTALRDWPHAEETA